MGQPSTGHKVARRTEEFPEKEISASAGFFENELIATAERLIDRLTAQ
jgi:hypothetical protein